MGIMFGLEISRRNGALEVKLGEKEQWLSLQVCNRREGTVYLWSYSKNPDAENDFSHQLRLGLHTKKIVETTRKDNQDKSLKECRPNVLPLPSC